MKLFLSSLAHLSTMIPSHLFLTQSDNMFWVKITHSPFQAEDLGVGEMRSEAARIALSLSSTHSAWPRNAYCMPFTLVHA